MNNMLLVLTLTLSQLSFAAPPSETIKNVLLAQPSCQTFVRYDDANLYLGFGSYKRGIEEPRLPISARMRVAPLDGSEPYELETKDGAVDVVTDGQVAWVLTFSSIEEWDLKERIRVAEYETYAIQKPLAYKQHSVAMARYNNKLIIAHGRLGVSIFDIKKKKLVNQFRLLREQRPLESMATAVTVTGNKAYVAMDNFSLVRDGKPPFRGVIVVNMENESVYQILPGLDPGSDAAISDSKKLIVSYMGLPIWKFDLASMDKGALTIEKPIWKFGIEGNPTGKPAMDEKYYYTCFTKSPAPANNGGVRKRAPVVLDRRVLMMD